jgi:hypothetical protein
MVKKAPKKQTKEEAPQLVEATPSIVKEPNPAPKVVELLDKPIADETERKPLELGRTIPAGIPTSVGMPKSKKPWKALSERSSKHKPYNPRSWKQKMADKRKLKAVRERVKEERERKKEARR